jgi:hypothetical protein
VPVDPVPAATQPTYQELVKDGIEGFAVLLRFWCNHAQTLTRGTFSSLRAAQIAGYNALRTERHQLARWPYFCHSELKHSPKRFNRNIDNFLAQILKEGSWQR